MSELDPVSPSAVDFVTAAIERFGPEAFGLEDIPDPDSAAVMVLLGAGSATESEAVELATFLLPTATMKSRANRA